MSTMNTELEKSINRAAAFKTTTWLGYAFSCIGLASKFAISMSTMSYESSYQFGRLYFFASWIGLLIAAASIVVGDLAKLRHTDAPLHYLLAWFGLVIPLAAFIYDYARGVPIWWYLVQI